MELCATCLWNDQCGEECCEGCEQCTCSCTHYSPIDDQAGDVGYYETVLDEAAAEYRAVVAEYADTDRGDLYG